MISTKLIRQVPLILLALCIALPVWAEDLEVVVRFQEGTVQIKSRFGAWRPAKTDEVVEYGSYVRVGPAGRCTIVIDEKNVLYLSPGTVLEVRSIEPTRLEMTEGEIFANVKKIKKGSTFQVKTPTAIAAVRGTGWRQSAERIAVFDGTLRVQGGGLEALELGQGLAVPVSNTGDLGEPEPVTEFELTQWQAFETTTNENPIPVMPEPEPIEEAAVDEEQPTEEEPSAQEPER